MAEAIKTIGTGMKWVGVAGAVVSIANAFNQSKALEAAHPEIYTDPFYQHPAPNSGYAGDWSPFDNYVHANPTNFSGEWGPHEWMDASSMAFWLFVIIGVSGAAMSGKKKAS